MNRILLSIVAFLSAEYGQTFSKSNQRIGRGATIPTQVSDMFQLRLTKPDAASGQGIRLSVQGDTLSDLATTDNGFGKLKFHLELGEKLQAHLGDRYTVSYSDTPRGESNGYPTIYVNTAQTEDTETEGSSVFDPSALVKQAKAVGVPADKILDAIGKSDYTGLRALVAFHTASDSEVPETDEDGDSPFES